MVFNPWIQLNCENIVSFWAGKIFYDVANTSPPYGSDFSPKPVFWALHTAPLVLDKTASISFFLVSGKLP